jgi:methanogenic corrinoid protein MtbC1
MIVERLFEALINGDRTWSRSIVDEVMRQGVTAEELVTDIYWPTYEMIANLFRNDQLSTLAHHMGTRLLRTLCDQAALAFDVRPANGRRVFAVCGPTDADELAAQMATDLLEREGFAISFAGGGIANDEVLAHVQEHQPNALLLFASAPSDLPSVRELIDTIHEIGACRQTQVVVGGGVFNRAEGLAEEIGADLWATSPAELAEAMLEQPARRAAADQRTVGRKRRPQAKAA